MPWNTEQNVHKKENYAKCFVINKVQEKMYYVRKA